MKFAVEIESKFSLNLHIFLSSCGIFPFLPRRESVPASAGDSFDKVSFLVWVSMVALLKRESRYRLIGRWFNSTTAILHNKKITTPLQEVKSLQRHRLIQAGRLLRINRKTLYDLLRSRLPNLFQLADKNLLIICKLFARTLKLFLVFSIFQMFSY